MRLPDPLRPFVAIVLGATLALSCSTEPDVSGATPSEAAPAPSEAPVVEATEPDPSGVALDFILPTFPDDIDVPEPVGVPGSAVPSEDLNTDVTWLWCDGDTATAIVGDIWTTEEGAGVVVELNTSQVEAGDELTFPMEPTTGVLFFVNLHDEVGIPTEYASEQEESVGSMTIESVPCRGDGADLAFQVDGQVGAETNPGFQAAAVVSGSLRLSETGPPPDSVLGE